MHAISGYRGNRPTNTQTHPQTGASDSALMLTLCALQMLVLLLLLLLQYTAPQLASAQRKKNTHRTYGLKDCVMCFFSRQREDCRGVPVGSRHGDRVQRLASRAGLVQHVSRRGGVAATRPPTTVRHADCGRPAGGHDAPSTSEGAARRSLQGRSKSVVCVQLAVFTLTSTFTAVYY